MTILRDGEGRAVGLSGPMDEADVKPLGYVSHPGLEKLATMRDERTRVAVVGTRDDYHNQPVYAAPGLKYIGRDTGKRVALIFESEEAADAFMKRHSL